VGKYSPDKAERLLGWKPKHGFKDFYVQPFRGQPDWEG
jgi:hypothetical protein